jgi:hypothetical protein
VSVYIYIALFFLVCFLLRDRLGQRAAEDLSEGIYTVLLLGVLLILYVIFGNNR